MSDHVGIEQLKGQQRHLEEEILKAHDEDWTAESDVHERVERMKDKYMQLGKRIESLEQFHATNAREAMDDKRNTGNRGVATDPNKPLTVSEMRRDAANAYLRATRQGGEKAGADAWTQKISDFGLQNITTGSSSAGAAVAELIVAEIIMAPRDLVGIRSVADAQTRDSLGGDDGFVFLTSGDDDKAQLVSQLEAAGEQDTALGSVVAKADEWTTEIIPVSYQTIEDASVDIVSFIRDVAVERWDEGQGQAMIQGDVNDVKKTNATTFNVLGAFETAGTSGGFGIATTYDTHQETAANNAVVEGDYRNVWGKVKQRFRNPAVGRWLMPTSLYLNAIVIKANAADNERLIKRNPERNEDTLFGNPITIDDWIPDSAAGARIAGFGDWRGYKIRDIREGGMLQVYDGDEYKKKRAVGYELIGRMAARPVDYYSVAVLTQAT